MWGECLPPYLVRDDTKFVKTSLALGLQLDVSIGFVSIFNVASKEIPHTTLLQ